MAADRSANLPHTCDPRWEAPCPACTQVRAELRTMGREIRERLGPPFTRPELGDVPVGPVLIVDDVPIWQRDWSTPEAARASFAAAMECDVADLEVQGPDGGPYVITFLPADPTSVPADGS